MKKFIHVSVWLVLVSALLVSLSFVQREHAKVVCKEVYVEIENNENSFVDRNDILNAIREKGDSLFNQPVEAINVNKLEIILNSHPSIANAEAFKAINGDLTIKIKQRKPIARIINKKGESYYIDEEGLLMPLSSNYTANVLVVNGNIAESYGRHYLQNFSASAINDSLLKNTMLDEVYRLAKYVNEDEFWKSQIVQVFIGEENELIPRVGEHKIIFGDLEDIDEKFKKLFMFYQKGLNKTGWNVYSTVNLKYKNQVVCTKAI